jgi:hypothetical protein
VQVITRFWSGISAHSWQIPRGIVVQIPAYLLLQTYFCGLHALVTLLCKQVHCENQLERKDVLLRKKIAAFCKPAEK